MFVCSFLIARDALKKVGLKFRLFRPGALPDKEEAFISQIIFPYRTIALNAACA